MCQVFSGWVGGGGAPTGVGLAAPLSPVFAGAAYVEFRHFFQTQSARSTAMTPVIDQRYLREGRCAPRFVPSMADRPEVFSPGDRVRRP